MSVHNLKTNGRRKAKDNLLSDVGFLPKSIEALKDAKPKSVKNTKIANTNVSKQVFKAFMMRCVHENKNHKEMFPEMLQHLIDKYNEKAFQQQIRFQNQLIDFKDKVNANFEYNASMIEDVKRFKAKNLIKYNTLYEQAIIQYINDYEAIDK